MKTLLTFVLFFLCAGILPAQTTTFNGVIKDLTNTPIPTGQVSFGLRPGIDTTISGNARFTSSTVFCSINNPAVVSTSGTGTITVVVGTAQAWQAGDKIIFVGTGDATLNASSVASPYTVTLVNSPTSYNFTQAGTHTNGAGGTVGGLYGQGGTTPCQVLQSTAINPANTYYSVSLWPIFSLTSTFNTYAIGSGPVDISTIVPTPGQQPAYSFVDIFTPQTITGQKTFSNTGNIYTGGTFSSPTINSATINSPSIFSPTFSSTVFVTVTPFAYTMTWSTPTAGRTINFPDPGGNDNVAYLAAVQTFTNKTLNAATFSGVINTGGATFGTLNLGPLISSTSVLKLPDGTAALPSFQFVSQANAGIDFNENGLGVGPTLVDNATEVLGWNPSGSTVHPTPLLAPGGGLGWSSSYAGGVFTGNGQSTGFSQPSAGIVSVDTTTNGNGLGTLKAAVLVPGAGVTVAALPSAASNPGAMIYVTDSTAIATEGQTCAGSSTNKALAFSNGTVWKCF
jgi:hypothetical protein